MCSGDGLKCSNPHEKPPKSDQKVRSLACGEGVYPKKASNPTLKEGNRAEQINTPNTNAAKTYSNLDEKTK